MEEEIKRLVKTSILKATKETGGGCISSGRKYEIDNEKFIFVKTNNKKDANVMFNGEHAGLEAIYKTETIRCPKSYGTFKMEDGTCGIVTEYISMNSSKNQEALGKQLAELHLSNEKHGTPIKEFGFEVPTCCGYLSINNKWNKNWTNFYIYQRFQLHIDMLNKSNPNKELTNLWNQCIPKIETILDRIQPIPALVHGDLWSGNVASDENGNPVIFDPACFYGHSEFDFGIAKMFGGFTKTFHDSYHKIIPKSDGFEERLIIYELFHHLNHWNHFGSGYASGTLNLMKQIIKF
uniref:protein-ribulosamine 3-kinase n=1 Tax=Panagrolaimus davidi TaxID=227884 RepID=A0A914R8F2_9BILA